MTKPIDRVLEALNSRGRSVRGSGGNYSAQCPAHADDRASLCIGENGNGDALVFCQAGCDTETKVLPPLGLKMSDLFAAAGTNGAATGHAGANGTAANHRGGSKATEYPACTIDGTVVAVHHRRDLPDGSKTMWWSRPGVAKGLGGMHVVDIPLYGTELLRAAPADVAAIVVEGEKSAIALRLRSMLALATTTGAGKIPSPAVLACLAQRDVVLWPDNDPPGALHMAGVALRLRGAAKSVRVVDVAAVWKDRVPEGKDPKGLDAADFHGTDDELHALLDIAPPAPGPDDSAERVFDPKRTLKTAQWFVREFHTHDDGRTLHSHAGTIVRWHDNRYVEVEEQAIKHILQPWLTASWVDIETEKGPKRLPFPANPRTVSEALETVRTYVHLPATTTSPAWLGSDPAPYPMHELLPCRTATLHIPTGNTLAPTPLLFAFNALDYDYDPAAPDPVRWYAFMRDVFGDDAEQIQLLQEWFGYVLTANTKQQKILLVVGPPRSGKGTIARVLTQLIGPGNVTGPTVSSLAGAFGLAPLFGKSLAIIADARFSGEGISIAIDLLKNISGEDAVAVNRKNRDAPTVTLPTRFVILANENPRLPDASAAIASRFLVLRTAQSFLDRENHDLTDELLTELPGILLWAIQGWHRLNERGRFLEPASSKQTVQDIGDLSSPVSAFLRERCVVGPNRRVLSQILYTAWKGWCAEEGHTHVSTAAIFGKDLAACIPGLKRREGSCRERVYDGVELK